MNLKFMNYVISEVNMIPTLQNIKKRLRNDEYSNEEQVRLTLVTPLLQTLGNK